jgi:spermidine synthase
MNSGAAGFTNRRVPICVRAGRSPSGPPHVWNRMRWETAVATDSWVNETLYSAWGQRFLVVRELARVQSEFQDIMIFESATHGRVMLLDGVVQITERDEFVYQEMLTHVPLLAHGAAKRVLIIGAGDGGVLRRVLQHGTVERAAMVEIDGEVIRLARQFLPGIAGNAWSDPRAEVIVGDGIDFVRTAPDASFDVVIVDSTDPIGVGEVLFTDAFYANAARILADDGLIVNQCGVPFMQPDELRETSARRRQFFPHVGAYVAAVPTYVGGFMTLGFAAKQAGLHAVDAATLRARAEAAGMLDATDYWTPEVQVGAFHLPPYIARHLPSV